MGLVLWAVSLTASAQCGITMSCGPTPPGGVFPVEPRKPCEGVCILSDQGRRQFEAQNHCYFADEYCGGTTAAHRMDRKTQCCGKNPATGRPTVQDKQITSAQAGFKWQDYAAACPNMRQSQGQPDALWPQCQVGQRHTASDDWVVQEVQAPAGNAQARSYCIDGCSTPPAWVNRMYRLGFFLFKDKDNPTGAGAGGIGASASFYQACAAHDRCYQTCNATTQSQCDNNLLNDMLAVCQNIPENHVTTFRNNLGFQDDENTRNKCQSAANNMHTGLQLGGGPAFRTRRQQYCQCC